MALSTVLPANSACLNGWQTAKYLKKNSCVSVGDRDTGRERLIRTRLIQSSTLFDVSMKYFPVIFLLFYV